MASGLFRRTSRLDRTPIAATRTAVSNDAADVFAHEDAPRNVERVAADAPGQRDGAERSDRRPPADPSTPYSNSSIFAIVRVLAPSVLKTAAS